MRKGALTRELILKRTAPLFNQRGYFGASLADVMQATGLEKGGIYNHFGSKEQLALEAFDYAVVQVEQRIWEAVAAADHAVDKLQAVVATVSALALDPPVPGGCPVMNTAVEADDAQPALRERARQALGRWHDGLRQIVADGLRRGEIRPGTDPDTLASVLLSTLEGAGALARLAGDASHVRHAAVHLRDYLEAAVRQ
ncbi:MAG TPA: TetR/AcrR family transcriptional regulator [Chloroflexota bacterium]|nr:TetR/AcrR family transcriptional regulator [Chloroflexota bacterium]